jgi:hypothetical protein
MITVLQFGANAILENIPNPPSITIQYKRKTMKVNKLSICMMRTGKVMFGNYK